MNYQISRVQLAELKIFLNYKYVKTEFTLLYLKSTKV